jgi:hypothetical protein
MKFTTATLLLFLWPLWAYAGQSSATPVAGTVDGPDGPVAGAAVTLANDTVTRETRTDDQGRYAFPPVAPGRYRLTASTAGLRATREITVSSTPEQVAMTLVPAFTDVSIVTASRGAESLLGASAAVSVVGEAEIAAAAADSVPGLLQGLPGLNVTQIGGRDIHVNARDAAGRLSNSMLVMVDGRPLNQPFYGAVFWDLMTVGKSELSQIEVVRTPASALWGANALNGAINIRTKSPREMLGLRGYLAGGERGSFSAGATWADAAERVSYKLSTSYFRQDAWDRDNTLPNGSPMPPLARFENRGTRQPKFDARVDWRDDGDRLWSFRGGLAGAHGLIHSALGPGEFAPGSHAAYLEADHQGSNYDLKVYWNRLDWPFRIVLFGLDHTATNDTYAAEATRQFALGDRHRLIAGGTLTLDRFDISVAPSDRQRVDGAAFVEDRIRLTDRVSAVAGARVLGLWCRRRRPIRSAPPITAPIERRRCSRTSQMWPCRRCCRSRHPLSTFRGREGLPVSTWSHTTRSRWAIPGRSTAGPSSSPASTTRPWTGRSGSCPSGFTDPGTRLPAGPAILRACPSCPTRSAS